MLKNQEVEEIVERLFKIKGAFHLTFWLCLGFSIWLVDIKKSEILCSVEAPEKLQETIFFLWNFRLVKYNWIRRKLIQIGNMLAWQFSVYTKRRFVGYPFSQHFTAVCQTLLYYCEKMTGIQDPRCEPVEIPPENQELLHSVVPMLTFTCICQRFLFAAFLQIGQVGAFPVCWNLPRVSMKRWLDPCKGSRDLALETSQSCRRPKWCDYTSQVPQAQQVDAATSVDPSDRRIVGSRVTRRPPWDQRRRWKK